jgi:hypothetical protein
MSETHFPECYREPTHHECALAKIKRQAVVIDAFKAASRDHPDVQLRRAIRAILQDATIEAGEKRT